jgi:hypothetical protein
MFDSIIKRWFNVPQLAVSIQNHLRHHGAFYVLQIGFSAWIIWRWPWDQLPVPGYAIGVLAVAAAVMSLHSDMKLGHRVVWILLLGAFLRLEIRAISKDRHDSELAHDADIAKMMAKFDAMLQEQRSLQDQQNDLELRSAAVLKEVGDKSYMTLLRRNNVVRSDLADANRLLRALEITRDGRMMDIPVMYEARIGHAATPEIKAEFEAPKARQVEDEEAGFEKLYRENVRPRLITVLRELLSASGLPVERDDAKVVLSYQLRDLQSAPTGIEKLKTLGARLVP